MTSDKTPSLGSYLVSGTLAILASWILTGCRFGNHVERADSVENLTGYYRSQPVRLMFKAVLQPQGGAVETREFAGNTDHLPDNWDIFLTDPSGVAMDPASSQGFLMGIVGDKGYKTPIQFTQAGQFNLVTPPQEIRFTDSPPCTQVWTLEGAGTLTQTAKSTYKDFPTRGNLSLTTSGDRRYQGDCSNVLGIFQSCLQDLTKCPGSTETDQKTWQGFVAGVYGPAILAGGITANDIQAIQELSYTLVYE